MKVEPADSPMTEFLNLTLEQKIAQMLMIGFRGLQIETRDSIYTDLVDRGIGGVVLFDVDVPTNSPFRNIKSPQQLADLTSQLQSLAKVPLLIAVDQEGGRVARLKPEYGFPVSVSHQWLGEQDCLAVARLKTTELAKTLAACGITVNFAPCVDLKLNPHNPIIAGKERSFSHDPDVVIRQSIEFIKAHHEQGVLCTLKHFPGHGSSRDDSHLGFVDITHSWWPDELRPFEKLIKLGLADAVMTAHVFHAKLDEKFPATLSAKIITEKLRGELGFTGPVFTDDMQMKAITSRFGLHTAIEKAVNAGVDVLVFGNNCEYDENIAARVINIFIKLLDTGKITENRIDESLVRIHALKGKFKVENEQSERAD